jgi:hypothetical protein
MVFVVTINVVDLAPTATVTVGGTVATAVLLLVRATMMPPVGAGPLSVTVPVDGLPPTTLVGLSVTEDNVAAVTVSVAF